MADLITTNLICISLGQCEPDEQEGAYRRSFDYIPIVRGEQRGVWAVPLIFGAVLLDRHAMAAVRGLPTVMLCIPFHNDINIYLSIY